MPNGIKLTKEQIESIEQGYYNALEWLTWDCFDWCNDEIPDDESFNIDDSTINALISDIVKQFISLADHNKLMDFAEHMQPSHFFNKALHHGMQSIGHDLYLTSHRHGAGFWDRGSEHSDYLTAIAEKMPELHVFYQSGKITAE